MAVASQPVSVPIESSTTGNDTPRPRVVLLTSAGLFGAEIINALASEPGLDFVGIGFTNRVLKNKGMVSSVRTLIKRCGWRYVSYGVLTSTYAWSVLRLSGRPFGMKGRALRFLKDVNSADSIEWLKSLQPDYVASFYFNQWIGKGVREVPAKACINLHPSLLPNLRGPDPFFRALQRDLPTTGITLHMVDDGFDTGSILCQEERPIAPGSSALTFSLTQVRDGAQLLAHWIAGKKENSRVEQAGEGDYTTFPAPAEVAQFVQSGRTLLRFRELRRALKEVR